MKPVSHHRHGQPITDPRPLEDLKLPEPAAPAGRDLLIRVHVVSINPRDVKSLQPLRLTGRYTSTPSRRNML